jgi:phosphatidylserine/phosphatidylglycerophosphate/cardiolipin synthase-like enzyme
VHDIALTFAERWNDSSRRTHPPIDKPISTTFLEKPIPPAGPHSVQVLRTYGIETKQGYSWARQGEFTIWAAYLNAIKQASRYIYIEDQYFYPFSEPSGYEKSTAKWREADPVYQLGQAVKRGVTVILLAPSRKGSRNPTNAYQLYARRRAVEYLRQVSAAEPGAGQVVACYLVAGAIDPVIHAKVMIVDDEFALVGSANVCRRSMTYDSEVHVGIVDAQNHFARDLRQLLWQEHLDLEDPGSLLDPPAAVATFYNHAVGGRGRVRLLDSNTASVPLFYNMVMNAVMDPYRGPVKNERPN